MKTELTLSLFDGTTYEPQRYSPKEIVENFINYMYVHLREKNYSEESIHEFITTLFPDDAKSVQFSSDNDLLEGIELASAIIKNDTVLFDDWSQEEKFKAIELIEEVLKIARKSKELLKLVHSVLVELIQRIRDKEFYPKDAFALPSHRGMFPILDLFSGRPQNIPRSILLKSASERTPEEEAIANKFISSIAKSQTTGYDHAGNEIVSNYVVICDTSSYYATSDLSGLTSLESDTTDLESNIIYIHKAFGSEGLRHFLTILSMLGEQGTQNEVVKWNLNDHLERMGYQRKSHGSFDKREKDIAIQMLRIFTTLNICIYRRTKKQEELNVRQLFIVVGFDVTKDISTQASKEELIIRADDTWYNKPAEINGEVPQFTTILKKVLLVNHHIYPHVHFLCIRFSLFWRIDLNGRKLKVSTLMKDCKFALKSTTIKKDIKTIEKELNYMKMEGYIGNWSNLTTVGKLPSETDDPLSQVILITPPLWFKKTMNQIFINKQFHTPIVLPKEFKILSIEEFQEVIRQTKLSISEFSERLGVSRQTISYLKSGKKPISKDISTKIWNTFPELFTENVNQT
jgi:hypothetical protein